MRYLSVCSGIEAASVAWEPLGWTPIAFSEIEKFPSKVLAHRFPNVPNLGDMTRYKEWNIERGSVDVLVGGTPCQSFSVAGLRKGLDDPRGNLALTFVAMVDHYRPEWVIWENVPGVLSSSGGRDFGSFLGALGQLGYGFAYRVLDAQYFGVPQRRRRVFVVAHSSGDSRRAAEVLFEPESLRGDTPKSRKTGQDTAQCLTTGTGCRYDPNTETLIPVMYQNNQTDARIKEETRTSQTVLARWGTGGGNTPLVGQPIAHAFQQNVREEVRLVNGDGQITGALSSNLGMHQQNFIIQPIALAENTIGRQPLNGGNGDGYTVGGPMYTLNATGVHGVAHPDHSMAVRRLTPTECERLQGFPDGWTNIHTDTPDGPRYKALGNSMAVPVMRWIGGRINEHR